MIFRAGGCELSVVLTAHDETLVCGPTLASANDAIAAAEDAGIKVERIVALDKATADTRQWFEHNAADSWTLLDFDEGDLGRVRNAVVPRTKGRFIAFLDADDLFSRNWLRAAVERLRADSAMGRRSIAHPELNWLFDGGHSVFFKPEQDDALFAPQHFYFMNYYDSLCMAPREAFLEHPYVARDIPAGLSFQDWQFSIETMAAGWHHASVKNTIIFKRRRDSSLVSESRTRRALIRQLECMAIDRVSDLGADGDGPGRPGLVGRLAQAFRPGPEEPGANVTPPHHGAALENRVTRAKARTGVVTDRKAYAETEPYFDHAYYLSRYPDILIQEEIDPIAHYIRAGEAEGRCPTPFFSARHYKARHPELAKSRTNAFHHWVQTASATDTAWTGAPFTDFETIAEMMGKSPQALFDLWRERQNELRSRLESGPLGEQVRRAEQHEPLIGQGWTEVPQLKVPPLHSDPAVKRVAAIWRLFLAADGKRAQFVICVNRSRFGSAPRAEGHLARALAAAHGADQVVVVTTDRPGPMPHGKLPDGVRHVDFAKLAPELNGDPRQRVLAEFLRALHPRCVFNVNSRLMWDMMTPYGTALSTSMHLHALLLCNEQSATGHWTGYPLRRVYRHFDQLSGVLTDSRFLADDLIRRYGVPPAQRHKIRVLPNPVDSSIPVAAPPKEKPGRRPRIYWAGRLDPQKRIDLVFDIAAQMPDCDFHVWGDKVMGAAPLPPTPPNLVLEGAYAAFRDLPLDQADCWLYTSAWDGVPTMLLEVAMTGVPIVGSDVGGTSEILRPSLADAMPPGASAADWALAIRAVLDNPERARTQALELRETLVAERTAQAHAKIVAALPGCTPNAAAPVKSCAS